MKGDRKLKDKIAQEKYRVRIAERQKAERCFRTE